LEWAADYGHREAQYRLAEVLLAGAADDVRRGLDLLKGAAEQEHPKAQCLLGMLYLNGKHVERDTGKAVLLLTSAADQKVRDAAYALGLCYAKGTGARADPECAARYYLQAAGAGHVDAQYEMFRRCREGDGVEKSDSESLRWCKLAADNPEGGHVEAMCAMGVFYATGSGTTKNPQYAFRYWCKAAEKGHFEAKYWQALCHITGKGVKKKDEQLAFVLFKEVVESEKLQTLPVVCQGEALYWVGWGYQHGVVGEEDVKTAAQWYQRAGALGHKEAHRILEGWYAIKAVPRPRGRRKWFR